MYQSRAAMNPTRPTGNTSRLRAQAGSRGNQGATPATAASSPARTARPIRLVYLAPGTLGALTDHRRRQIEDQLAAGPEWKNTGLVFTTAVGRPADGTWVTKWFHRALAEAGLPRIRIHDLRHTAATHLLSRGVHPKVVQELLGHSTISLTLDTYSHVAPALHAEVASQMQVLFR